MSLDQTSTANYLLATAALDTTPPLAFGCAFKTSIALARRIISFGKRGSDTDVFAMVLDTQTADGKLGCRIQSSSPAAVQEVLTGPITAGAWNRGSVAFVTTFTRDVMLNGGAKVSATGTVTPSGVNGVEWSGRMTDHLFNVGGPRCHDWACTAVIPPDVARQYLGLGGHPRAIKEVTNYWKGNRTTTVAGALVVPDEIGSFNGPVVGSGIISTDNPDQATFFTAAAISNQLWQQNVAISGFPTAWDDVSSAFTVTVMRVSDSAAATQHTTAAGTAVRVVPIDAQPSPPFASGDYVSVNGARPTRVLDVLALNLLVKDDQTFASGATAARRTVAAATAIAGVTFSATGTPSGTPTGSQANTQNYFLAAQCTAQPTNARLRFDANSFDIQIGATAVVPAFSSNPVISGSTTDGFTMAFTVNVACTCLASLVASGASQPNVLSGGGTLHNSVSATGNGSISLTGLIAADIPYCDIYLQLTNAQGNSAVFKIGQQVPPPRAQRQYRFFGPTIDPNTKYAGHANGGDLEDSDLQLVPSGVLASLRPDGNESYTGPSGRQERTARIWDVTNRAWRTDATGAQVFRFWYNAAPPTPQNQSIRIPVGSAMTAFDCQSLFTSVDSGQLTIALLDALPAGLAIGPGPIGPGRVTGTATSNGLTIVRVQATDFTGLSSVATLSIQAGKVIEPNVYGQNYQPAQSQLAAALLQSVINFVLDPGQPDIVIFQDPPALTELDPGATVTLTVTKSDGVPFYGLKNHSFDCVPQANGNLDMHDPDGP